MNLVTKLLLFPYSFFVYDTIMHEFSNKSIVVPPLVFDNGTIMHELVTKLLLCPYSFCLC